MSKPRNDLSQARRSFTPNPHLSVEDQLRMTENRIFNDPNFISSKTQQVQKDVKRIVDGDLSIKLPDQEIIAPKQEDALTVDTRPNRRVVKIEGDKADRIVQSLRSSANSQRPR